MSEIKNALNNKNTDKYKVALKFVNNILVNLEKDVIDDLTKFKDIDREDIIKDVNKKSLMDMEKELFAHFDKKKCGYYRKTDAIVLNCLRGIIKEAGFKLSFEQKDRHEVIGDKSYKRSHSLYYIH